MILSDDAIQRILEHTGIKVTDDIQKRAESLLGNEDFVRQLSICQNALVVYAMPSEMKKDLNRALKSCQNLYDLFSGKKMDENRFSDFALLYNQTKNEFGTNYVPKVTEIADLMKRMEFVLCKAIENNQEQIGSASKYTGNDVLCYLDHKLLDFFKEIYQREPTVNSKPRNCDSHDSPFLRFSSKTIMELIDIPFDLSPDSATHDAIRKRINRSKTSS